MPSSRKRDQRDCRVGELIIAVTGDASQGYALAVESPGGQPLALIKAQSKAEAGEALHRVICDFTRTLQKT